MYKTKINGRYDYEVTLSNDHTSGTLNGEKFDLDSVRTGPNGLHIIHNNQSYPVEVVRINRETKTVELKVRSRFYTVSVKDRMDLLLEQLGMDMSSAAAVSELKAPMPGLVIDVRVKPGDVISKGDALMVLEAMKMENVLKSPADVIIDKIVVESGSTIEKNQTLITFK